MSKRAEEAALKAYPVNRIIHRGPDADNEIIYVSNEELRRGCIKGYKLAEKDLGWHSVDECLPPIVEEVIVLTDEMHGKKLSSACHISYGHRPNPEGWDGKDIITGKVTHHDVVTYDGWNIPGVKYWMHCPKLPEK